MTTFGLTGTELDQVLAAATRAPSLHNSQPWSFRITPERIEIHLDHDRLLPVADPDGRESRIGCGAALFNLRLALSGHGVTPIVTVLPRGGEGPLAVIQGGGRAASSPGNAELERAIAHRRTNRRPFFSAEVPAGHQEILRRAAEVEGGVVHFIDTPAELQHIREQAAVAHRTQLANPAWVAEWNAWTRRVNTDDGVPLAAAGPAPAPQDFFTLRDFGTPGRPERLDGRDFEEQPLIAVLATHADTPVNQVNAGQTLQRLLLAGTVLGLSASFLSQLIEVPSAKSHLRVLTGGYSHPQTVLRIGFGNPTPATPRRSVADCLRSRSDDLVGHGDASAHR